MIIDFTELLIVFSQILDLLFPDNGLQGVSRAFIVTAILAMKNAPKERRQSAFIASLLYSAKHKMDVDITPLILKLLSIYNSSISNTSFSEDFSIRNDIDLIKIADKFYLHSIDEIKNDNYPSSTLKYLCNSMDNEFSIDHILYLREVDLIPGIWANLGKTEMIKDLHSLSPFPTLRLSNRQLNDACSLMAEIIDEYCQLPLNYSKRISEYSAKLAELYGFSLVGVETMRLAGLLHGTGKLSLPTNTLLNIGSLREQDLILYKSYPLITRKILLNAPGFFYIARIASHVHEKLNGNGFPEGFKSREISLSARIISVSRAYVHLQMVTNDSEDCLEKTIKKLHLKCRKGFLDASVVNALTMKILSRASSCPSLNSLD